MVKFTPEEDAKLKGLCEFAYGVRNLEPYPSPKFVKGKKAKKYIPDADKHFREAMSKMTRNGLPCLLDLTPENTRLHTSEFWEPLGIVCELVIGVGHGTRHVRFSESKTPGAASRYVTGVVSRRAQLQDINNRIASAQREILEKTSAYEESVKGLLAEAGVYSFHPPIVQFIDFTARPFRGYETTMPFINREISHVPEQLTSGVDFDAWARNSY